MLCDQCVIFWVGLITFFYDCTVLRAHKLLSGEEVRLNVTLVHRIYVDDTEIELFQL